MAKGIVKLAKETDEFSSALCTDNDSENIESILQLYLRARDNFISLDPNSPEHDSDQALVDSISKITSSLAEKAATIRCKTQRDVTAKLILALLEGDVGNVMNPGDDRSTRLSASATVDLLRISDTNDLEELLTERGISYLADIARVD